MAKLKVYAYKGVRVDDQSQQEGTLTATMLAEAQGRLLQMGIEGQVWLQKGVLAAPEGTVEEAVRGAIQDLPPEKLHPEIIAAEPVIESTRPALRAPLLRALQRRGRLWSPKERILFLRQLSTFLISGVPYGKALRFLADSAETREIQGRIQGILQRISGNKEDDPEKARPAGRSLLTWAFEESELFLPVQLGLVEAGEESGRIGKNLEHMASLEEGTLRIRERVLGKLAYPVFAVLLLWLAAPLLGHLLGEIVLSLQALTSAPNTSLISSLAGWLASPAWPLLSLGLPLLMVWGIWRSAPWWTERLPSMPIVGPAYNETQLAISIRVLAQLLESGLSLDKALDLTGNVAAPQVWHPALKRLREGRPLQECLAGSIPTWVLGMVTAGAESGNLDELLHHAADLLEETFHLRIEQMLVVLEPLLLGLLGLIALAVGLLVVGPLSQMIQAL